MVTIVTIAATLLFAAVGAGESVDWPRFGNDGGNSKYSPLDQIDAGNFDQVEVVWTWESVDARLTERLEAARKGDVEAADREDAFAVILAGEAGLPTRVRPGPFKAVPVVIDGRMYVSTALGQVAAIDAASGEPLWSYDPQSWEAGRPANMGFQHRGVAFWQRGGKKRVLMPTHDRRLLSLDAMTGKPDPDFGGYGAVDMTRDLGREVTESRTTHSSPPSVCRDVVIVGSIVSDAPTRKEAPPGHVRAYHVESGEVAWVFHTIPQPGEEGHDTWEEGSWEYTGGTNVWSMITVDEELGLAYLPISTPTNDLYGGHRLGDNLFAESLVAVDCETGEKRWHFQMVHHGLWDYDLPTAPTRIDVKVGDRLVKAVAQPTKQAFLFVFDAETGEPLWPIEEKPVPTETAPGDRASPTQPFPTKPAAYDRQGISEDDLIDFSPELHREALEIAADYELVPLYTPPRLEGDGRPTIQLPADGGGTNWTGAAVDPESGLIYVPSHTRPVTVSLTTPDPNRSNMRYTPRRWFDGIRGPRGLPLVKPPYSRITAIDLATGEHAWVAAHGEGPRNHPTLRELGLGRLGRAGRAAPLVTRTLLFVTQSAENTTGGNPRTPDRPPEISVYDKNSGAYLGGIELPDSPNSNLITYQVDGRQYLAVSVGGGRPMIGGGGTPARVVALALPSPGAS